MSMFVLARTSLAMLLLAAGLGTASAEDRSEDPATAALLARGLAAADATINTEVDQEKRACGVTQKGAWPGLTVRDGKVTDAAILKEIDGFAKVANTTGGLGGELAIVTTTADYDPKSEQPIPGSLRSLVVEAAKDRQSRWIVFSPLLGPNASIDLKADITLPDNISIDGSCADVTLQSPERIGGLDVYSKRNVVINGLRFHKTDYASTKQKVNIRSALRLNGKFDAVAILHNDLSQCGDGCIDITVSPNHPMPDVARVTVAFNRIADHDKTMLFGTIDCNHPELGTPLCDAAYFERYKDSPPHLFLTLEGNIFLRTSQRHPRIFGHVYAHLANNVIAYSALPRGDGGWSASYGTVVLATGRALIEDNIYVPLTTQDHAGNGPLSVSTGTTPGSAFRGSIDGFIRLQGNRTTRQSTLVENEPGKVADPPYEGIFKPLPLASLPPEQAIACVDARAGRAGGSAWDRKLCGAHSP